MKKFLAAACTAALVLSSSGAAFAGGLNDVIVDPPMVEKGPASSFPMWIIIPIVACLVLCGNGGNDEETTDLPTPG